MGKFYNPKNNPELNAYFKNENIENTDFASYEDLNVREPDAFIGFTNDIFLNPQAALIDVEENNELELYD